MSRRNESRRAKQRRHQRQKRESRKEAVGPDPRLITVEVTAIGGVPVKEPTFIYPVDRLRLPNKKVLAFHAPSIPAFYLLTAKELRDSGEQERQKVMATLKSSLARDEFNDLDVADDSLAMDALGKLASAVVLSAAAIEAYANEAIDRLDSTATVNVKRRGADKEVAQPEMVREFRLEEKLDLVAPLASGQPSIKGTRPWETFRKLNELRGEVVHVKARGRTDDPDVPSVLGRLLTGEGSRCIEDAASVIVACDPAWLPKATQKALG